MESLTSLESKISYNQYHVIIIILIIVTIALRIKVQQLKRSADKKFKRESKQTETKLFRLTHE